jgi:hypothetical protein
MKEKVLFKEGDMSLSTYVDENDKPLSYQEIGFMLVETHYFKERPCDTHLSAQNTAKSKLSVQ